MFAEHLHVCLMTILENSPSGDGYDRKEDAIIAFIAEIFRPGVFFRGRTEIKTQIKNLITSHLVSHVITFREEISFLSEEKTIYV